MRHGIRASAHQLFWPGCRWRAFRCLLAMDSYFVLPGFFLRQRPGTWPLSDTRTPQQAQPRNAPNLQQVKPES
ncbi:hypothetical protein ABIE53_000201 [Burkholderia sp. OAS925]